MDETGLVALTFGLFSSFMGDHAAMVNSKGE